MGSVHRLIFRTVVRRRLAGRDPARRPIGTAEELEEYRDCVTDMCEVRLRRFDGIFRWFSLRREPLLDQSGLVTRWFGTGIDIEAIKQRETLHAAEKRTMELIADGASLKDVLDQFMQFHRCTGRAVCHNGSFERKLIESAFGMGAALVSHANGFQRLIRFPSLKLDYAGERHS